MVVVLWGISPSGSQAGPASSLRRLGGWSYSLHCEWREAMHPYSLEVPWLPAGLWTCLHSVMDTVSLPELVSFVGFVGELLVA